MNSSASIPPGDEREPTVPTDWLSPVEDPPVRTVELEIAERRTSRPGQEIADEFAQLHADLGSALARLFRERSVDYQVPKRFGMGPLMGMMLLYSVIFAILKWGDAPQWIYLFLGLLGVVIGFGQMQGQANPRFSSIVTGAFALPGMFLAFTALFYVASGRGGPDPVSLICVAVSLFFFGGFVGYLAGTVLAGVFLVGDRVEQAIMRRATAGRRAVGDGDLSGGVST